MKDFLNKIADGPLTDTDDEQLGQYETTARYVEVAEEYHETQDESWSDWKNADELIETFDEGEPGERGRQILEAAIQEESVEEMLSAWRIDLSTY